MRNTQLQANGSRSDQMARSRWLPVVTPQVGSGSHLRGRTLIRKHLGTPTRSPFLAAKQLDGADPASCGKTDSSSYPSAGRAAHLEAVRQPPYIHSNPCSLKPNARLVTSQGIFSDGRLLARARPLHGAWPTFLQSSFLRQIGPLSVPPEITLLPRQVCSWSLEVRGVGSTPQIGSACQGSRAAPYASLRLPNNSLEPTRMAGLARAVEAP
jgi:hypothetical protein